VETFLKVIVLILGVGCLAFGVSLLWSRDAWVPRLMSRGARSPEGARRYIAWWGPLWIALGVLCVGVVLGDVLTS